MTETIYSYSLAHVLRYGILICIACHNVFDVLILVLKSISR